MNEQRTITLDQQQWLALAAILDEHVVRSLGLFCSVDNELAQRFANIIGEIHAACGVEAWGNGPLPRWLPSQYQVAHTLINQATKAAIARRAR